MGTVLSKGWPETYYDSSSLTIDEVVSRAKTGDLILFSGEGFFSTLIKCVSACKLWSHVGMVVVLPDGRKLITEAEKDIIGIDLVRGVGHTGIQFVDLRQRLRMYESRKLAYRPLLGGVKPAHVERVISKFAALADDEVPLYNEDIINFVEFATRTDMDDNIIKGKQYYVCTAWVGRLLIDFQICNADWRPGNYALSSFGMTHQDIPTLNHGFSFGEIAFVYP